MIKLLSSVNAALGALTLTHCILHWPRWCRVRGLEQVADLQTVGAVQEELVLKWDEGPRAEVLYI